MTIARGEHMQTMLVMRQLSSVLDRLLSEVTRSLGLPAEDVLVLGWLADRPGIPASQVAWKVGRSRQNLQRALERLEQRGFTQRYESCVRNRAAGWALTESGNALWADLLRQFDLQEQALLNRGLVSKGLLDDLERLTVELIKPRRPTWGLGLLDLPQPEKTPDWDL